MTPDAAVADLIDALAQAERGLPAGSRFRPWIAQARTELLVTLHGGRISAAQVARLEARRREVQRERPPWPRLDVAVSPPAIRLRRAGALARRAFRLVRRENRDVCLAAYLAALGRLLFAVARALDGDAVLYVRRERRPLRRAGGQRLQRGLAPG
jgi:hypothetical protein